jgi:predicted nucleic-acid-binding protein
MSSFSGSLDANVLLRLLLKDVSNQHRVAVTLLKESSGQLAVADIAVIEVVFVLDKHYSLSRSQIAEAIEGLMSLANINCNQELFEKAVFLFSKFPKLSFEDCCLASYAELNKAEPLWTFDQKLANQAPSAKLLPSS